MHKPQHDQPGDTRPHAWQPDSAHQGDKKSLLKHVAIFQLKLIADGLRDAMLVPVSLLAALGGLLFRSHDHWLWYREVLLWGRTSDQWIDLFDCHRQHPEPDFDSLLQATRARLDQDLKQRRPTAPPDDEPPQRG